MVWIVGRRSVEAFLFASLSFVLEGAHRIAALPFPWTKFHAMLLCDVYLTPKGALTMEWVTPQHEEIDLNCEVSSYANAEL
jgi:hypothetical protein